MTTDWDDFVNRAEEGMRIAAENTVFLLPSKNMMELWNDGTAEDRISRAQFLLSPFGVSSDELKDAHFEFTENDEEGTTTISVFMEMLAPVSRVHIKARIDENA